VLAQPRAAPRYPSAAEPDRYKRTLIRGRTAEKQRVEKLLEDPQIKLPTVISDIFGMSGRLMLEAMIAGQRDPRALAQLASDWRL
jgi:hypothetical protein